MHFQDLILTLQRYWAKQGCVLQQPYDLEKGAGTSHPATFLRALGPEPWRAAYVEPSRRPSDGRYGENPNRLGHYYQFQVILKPSPLHVQELYLDSLRHIGIDPLEHDLRFVEDDWENPTLGAWGLGWEVWSDGMEVTQFTYFQQCGGLDLPLVSAELTYGLERLCMYLQNVNNVYDLIWAQHPDGTLVKYGDVHHQSEVEFSRYHFEASDAALLFRLFDSFEADAARLLDIGDQDPKRSLVLPAYDLCLKCSHTFNQLNARGAISVTERQRYIKRVRDLAKRCAESYLRARYLLGFPLLKDEAARTTAKADFEKSELGARLLDPARRVG